MLKQNESDTMAKKDIHREKTNKNDQWTQN